MAKPLLLLAALVLGSVPLWSAPLQAEPWTPRWRPRVRSISLPQRVSLARFRPRELSVLASSGSLTYQEVVFAISRDGRAVTLLGDRRSGGSDETETSGRTQSGAGACPRWVEVTVGGEPLPEIPLPLATDLKIEGVTSIRLYLDARPKLAGEAVPVAGGNCLGSLLYTVRP
jgi:hypothetical protein